MSRGRRTLPGLSRQKASILAFGPGLRALYPLPTVPGALAPAYVLALAAHRGFVRPNGAKERRIMTFVEAFPDALHEEPRRRLPDADLRIPLHAGASSSCSAQWLIPEDQACCFA